VYIENNNEQRPHRERPKSVLGKVGLILAAFHDDDFSLSLAELTSRTGIAKATVYRLCQELVEGELLERDGSKYRLGLQLYEIGLRAPRQRTLREAARPIVENLAQHLDNAVNLAVPNASELLCIEHAGGHRNRARSTVGGRRLRLHCSAAGKLTLAMLPDQYPLSMVIPLMDRRTPRTLTPARLSAELIRIRGQNYATEVEENRPGYLAIAVPVRDGDGAYLAALAVVAPTAGSNIPRMLVSLTEGSRAITSRLALFEAHRAPL
jgi:DNA-binding IclR family transcriptional regulator